MQPGDAHTIPRLPTLDIIRSAFYNTDDLMPDRERVSRRRDVTFHGVQVGAAYTAGMHSNEKLACTGPGFFDLNQLEGAIFDWCWLV